MRYVARCSGWEEATEYTVTDAVLHDNRLSVDWLDDVGTGHLEATSTDGVLFRGNFGYRDNDGYSTPNLFRHVEFTLARTATGELIFLGRWWNTEKGSEGEWVIRLTRPPAA